MNLVLIYFALKYKGDFDKIYKALKNNEPVSQEKLDDIKSDLKTGKLKAITMLDDKYPETFKELEKPPFVLFYIGDLGLLSDDVRKMTLTGEKPDEHSKKYVNDLLSRTSLGFVPIINCNSDFEVWTAKQVVAKDQPIIIFNSAQINTFSFDWKSGKRLLISHTPAGLPNSTKKISQTNKMVSVLSDKLWVFSSGKQDYVGKLVKEFKKLKKVIFCFQDGKGDLGNKRFLNKKSNLIEEMVFNKIGDE